MITFNKDALVTFSSHGGYTINNAKVQYLNFELLISRLKKSNQLRKNRKKRERY